MMCVCVFRMNKELLLQPLVVARSEHERCLIEASVNSVRVSLKIKQLDAMDVMLVERFSAFLQQRAEDFVILRRKAVEVHVFLFICCVHTFHQPFISCFDSERVCVCVFVSWSMTITFRPYPNQSLWKPYHSTLVGSCGTETCLSACHLNQYQPIYILV